MKDTNVSLSLPFGSFQTVQSTMSHPSWLRSCLWIAALLGSLASCTKSEPPPRSRDDIFQDRRSLPAVWLTVKSHKRIIAPTGQALFTLDPETGEMVWPALFCANLNCPGKRDGEPLLFIEPDTNCTCPRCSSNRWVRPYLLPETAEMMKQLDSEHQKRAEYERANRVAPTLNNPSPPPSSGGPQPTKADPASRL